MVASIYSKSLSPRHVIYAGVDIKENGCWEWRHGRQAHGYGVVFQEGGHRYAYRAWYGEIPTGAHVLHRCDNPPCCNPAHLYLGSHKDNMGDMGARRRQWLAARRDRGEAISAPVVSEERRARGERVGTSKLTADQIDAIRKDTRKQRDVAAEYGISQAQVWRIKHRRSWAHA